MRLELRGRGVGSLALQRHIDRQNRPPRRALPHSLRTSRDAEPELGRPVSIET